MQNIIIESEHDTPSDDHEHPFDLQGPLAEVEQVPTQLVVFLHMHQEIRDTGVHTQVENDVVEHLWVQRGNTTLFCMAIYFNYYINNLIVCLNYFVFKHCNIVRVVI
jgi:hypothetical protein